MNDLRYALGSIRRRPFVAVAVIVTLGLGIGANAAIFRAFNAAFLRPLPFRDEDRLVRLVLASPDREQRLSPRPDVFLAARDHSRSFASLAGQRLNEMTLTTIAETRRVSAIEVSHGWARTLGITPQLGRVFSAEEERQGTAAGVALIGDAMWRAQFGAIPDILGKTMSLNGRSFTIVGVLPPGVRFPYEAEVWLPVRFDAGGESTWALNIVGRLGDGVTHAAAVEELRGLSARLPEVQAQTGMSLYPIPIRETLMEDGGPMVLAVTLAAAFLLLLVTVNVANLLAADAMSRRQEFAIRAALGAGFARLLRQTMTEGLVLAVAAGAVGMAIAAASTSILAVLVPENFAYVFEPAPLDARVLLFSAMVVIVTGCVFGAIPALRVARIEPQAALIGGTRVTESRGARLRVTIAAAAQLALALVLLAAAHSMIRDVQQRIDRDLGHDIRNVLTASVVLPQERYPDAETRNRFFAQLEEALSSIPGVEAAGTVNLYPMQGQGALLARIEGEGVPYRTEAPMLSHNRLVDGDLIGAMKLRMVAGRPFTADELRRGEPVAVISHALARALWPDGNPIGKRVRNRRLEDAPWLRVVGVASDLEEFYADTTRAIWQPVRLNAASGAAAQATLVLRSQTPPDSLVPALRSAVQTVDPGLAVSDIITAEGLYRASLSGRESARTLTGAFAALGWIVAAIGVYASMAFAMSRRMRELAVRMALGATPRLLLGQFLARAASVIAAGVLAGIAAALVLARAGRSIAAEFPLDATSLLLAAALLSLTGLAASWLPLRRALRLDPSAVLQSE